MLLFFSFRFFINLYLCLCCLCYCIHLWWKKIVCLCVNTICISVYLERPLIKSKQQCNKSHRKLPLYLVSNTEVGVNNSDIQQHHSTVLPFIINHCYTFSSELSTCRSALFHLFPRRRASKCICFCVLSINGPVNIVCMWAKSQWSICAAAGMQADLTIADIEYSMLAQSLSQHWRPFTYSTLSP